MIVTVRVKCGCGATLKISGNSDECRSSLSAFLEAHDTCRSTNIIAAALPDIDQGSSEILSIIKAEARG